MREIAYITRDRFYPASKVAKPLTRGITTEYRGAFFPAVEQNATVQVVLSVLRFLRIFRALKIVRIFMEADLTWTEEAKFQSFIGAVITVNSLLMGMETDIKWAGWSYIEQVLLSIYVFELAVRLPSSHYIFLMSSDYFSRGMFKDVFR